MWSDDGRVGIQQALAGCSVNKEIWYLNTLLQANKTVGVLHFTIKQDNSTQLFFKVAMIANETALSKSLPRAPTIKKGLIIIFSIISVLSFKFWRFYAWASSIQWKLHQSGVSIASINRTVKKHLSISTKRKKKRFKEKVIHCKFFVMISDLSRILTLKLCNLSDYDIIFEVNVKNFYY